jgi:hypothetical protein
MEIRERLTPREGRRFAFTVGAAFCVLAALLAWRGYSLLCGISAGLGGALVLAGVLAAGRLSGVYRAWMGLALAMSRITSPVVMAVLYFLVLSPIGLLLRLLGRNPVRHAEREGGFWISASSAGASELENQF